MSKFNTIIKEKSVTVNHEGAEAFRLSAEMELYTAVVTASLSNKFYETADERAAAFGHDLTMEDWRKLHTIVDTYTGILFGTPLLAVNVAHPLLQEIRDELQADSRQFSFLCGHDSNLASVLSALGVEAYLLPDTVEQHTPIGAKLVFSRWLNEKGEAFWSVELVYQNTDQLRGMTLLSQDNPPEQFRLQPKTYSCICRTQIPTCNHFR
jgi:glucose-1-phosphatase